MRTATLLLCVAIFVPNSYASMKTASHLKTQPAYHHLKRGQLQSIISEAIQRYANAELSRWSFQVSRYENEEGNVTTSIERFDPRHSPGKKWTLLRTNDNVPSEQQIQAFLRKKTNDDKHLLLNLSEMIQVDSLQWTAEDTQMLYAQFNVHLSELGKEASKHLQGSLIFNKSGGFIEHIKIVNTREFSPLFTATIHNLSVSLTFQKINEAVLPKLVEMRMQGRFAYFTEINEQSSDTYSDFQFQG